MPSTHSADRPLVLGTAGLLNGPTPLECWERFGQLVGLEVWAKRDDALTLGLGGSKLRKLDAILYAAVQSSATVVLTTGAIQSNHCSLTAAAAARLGLKCVLFLRGAPPEGELGNVLLDRLFGAEVIFVGDVSHAEADHRMTVHAAELATPSCRPFVIPFGGATAEGTAAHVLATKEVADQCLGARLRPTVIVVAAGSGSTFAGICLGAEKFLPDTRVIGVSASWSGERLREESMRLIGEASSLLGLSTHLTPEVLELRAEFIGPGYTLASDGGREALATVAATQGVLLDLTYTSKVAHALMTLARNGEIPLGPVIFWHTGGVAEIFSRVPHDLGL